MKQKTVSLIARAKPKKKNNIKFFTSELFTHQPKMDYSEVEYRTHESFIGVLSNRPGIKYGKVKTREIATYGVDASVYLSVADFVCTLMLLIQEKKQIKTEKVSVSDVRLEQIE